MESAFYYHPNSLKTYVSLLNLLFPGEVESESSPSAAAAATATQFLIMIIAPAFEEEYITTTQGIYGRVLSLFSGV